VRYDATYYYNDGALWDNTGNPLKRVENFGASDFTTTLRYDNVYRETEETKRDSGGAVVYTHTYAYDAVGNRLVRNDGGPPPWLGYTYDANDKLTATRPVGSGPPGPITANFYYDGAGNMTSVTGTEFGSKTLAYDDESRLTSITYGAVTDSYAYNWQGLRTRAYLNGTYYRYLYNGERVLQELTDAGAVTATYTTENDSYYGTLLHLKRATGESRFPLYDSTGSARGLVDANGAVTDTYEMDTFGKPVSTTGSTPNPYRFGGAWGYMTDPSGFLQLGARFYWPEVGRFISQDPIGDGMNWYVYASNEPLYWIDPTGFAYSDLNITLGLVTFGIQYGNDPAAYGKPWSPWHASTWRDWHPYVGPAVGFGASLQYAPDIPDPVSGKSIVQRPSSGWYRQFSVGIPIRNPYVGIGGSVGNKLDPCKPWYVGFWDTSGNLPWFGEIGIATLGVSVSAPYVW